MTRRVKEEESVRRRSPVPDHRRCQCGNRAGGRCANPVWSRCKTGNLCFRHNTTHPSYNGSGLSDGGGLPERRIVTKRIVKTKSGRIVVEHTNLEPVVEEKDEVKGWDLIHVDMTPVPVTSEESHSDSAPEIETFEYCKDFGRVPFPNCDFCNLRLSRHHGRCCHQNPYVERYPIPPPPTWNLSATARSVSLTLSEAPRTTTAHQDVEMAGKRKRTYEESTDASEKPASQTIEAMEDWLQKTELTGSIDQWSVKAKPLVMIEEDA